MLRTGLSVLALAIAVGNGAAASATPYVDVTAFWRVQGPYYTAENPSLSQPRPNAITMSCIGGGVVGPPLPQNASCGDSQQLIQSVNHSELLSVSSLSGFQITNTTGQTFSGTELTFLATFTAFNSGGPQVGISIDDPLRESARFSSSVSGPGVGDSHACSTTDPLGPFNFTPTTCGVPSALGPGQSEEFLYRTSIVADFVIPVPEPSSLAVIGSALLLGLGGLFVHRSFGAGPA